MTYRYGPFSTFLQGRWIDGGILDRTRIESTTAGLNTIDDNTVPSTFYMDLNLGYKALENENLEVFFNVQNVLDRAPVSTPGVIGRAGTTEFNTALHDVVGRRFAIGVNYEF